MNMAAEKFHVAVKGPGKGIGEQIGGACGHQNFRSLGVSRPEEKKGVEKPHFPGGLPQSPLIHHIGDHLLHGLVGFIAEHIVDGVKAAVKGGLAHSGLLGQSGHRDLTVRGSGDQLVQSLPDGFHRLVHPLVAVDMVHGINSLHDISLR